MVAEMCKYTYFDSKVAISIQIKSFFLNRAITAECSFV